MSLLDVTVLVLVDPFNQEKAIVGAFSVIVKLSTSRRIVSSLEIT